MTGARVWWLEQTGLDVAAGDGWLSPLEKAHWGRIRFAQRRSDWLLGRWTAKRALASLMSAEELAGAYADIEIRPAPSGAPEPFVRGCPARTAVSLTHRDGVAACSVGIACRALGCDLELIEGHTPAFVQDYFVEEERNLVAHTPAIDRPLVITLIWSAKESALKALGTGLHADTRSVTVMPVIPDPCRSRGNWRPLRVRTEEGEDLAGWWRDGDRFVRTVVASPAGAPPTMLGSAAWGASLPGSCGRGPFAAQFR
jgi:4'-phosphopantetheinyl transferase